MRVFEGDEWKHAAPEKPSRMTRAEAQRRLDEKYATGRMEKADWLLKTDMLSEPELVDYATVLE